MMSEDVSSLEALRQRVEEATHGVFDGLDTLNTTVNDIEARSAAALDTSQQALQVTTASVLSVSKSSDSLTEIKSFSVIIIIYPIFSPKLKVYKHEKFEGILSFKHRRVATQTPWLDETHDYILNVPLNSIDQKGFKPANKNPLTSVDVPMSGFKLHNNPLPTKSLNFL